MQRCFMFKIRQFSIVKISLPPKFVSKFNTISTKIPGVVFVETDKIVLKLIQKGKGIPKTAAKQQSDRSYYLISDLHSYKNHDCVVLPERETQISRTIKKQEIAPCKYGQLILDKDAKTIQQRKDNLFNKLWWHHQISVGKKTIPT